MNLRNLNDKVDAKFLKKHESTELRMHDAVCTVKTMQDLTALAKQLQQQLSQPG